MPGARHFWPLIWATHAHGSNPLALRIPRELPTHGAAAGAGARGAGPRAPRVGRAAWACHGFCCVPSPAGGGGVGGEMKERREGEKRERQCRRGRGWRRDRETRRQRKEGGETSRGSPGRQKGERGRGEAAKGKDEQRESPGLPGDGGWGVACGDVRVVGCLRLLVSPSPGKEATVALLLSLTSEPRRPCSKGRELSHTPNGLPGPTGLLSTQQGLSAGFLIRGARGSSDPPDRVGCSRASSSLSERPGGLPSLATTTPLQTPCGWRWALD